MRCGIGFLSLMIMINASAGTREDFLKLIDRPRVDLAANVDPPKSDHDLLQYHFAFAADADSRVPGILLKKPSLKGPTPVIIVLHGTGGTKESELPLLRELAQKGFIAVAIDGRYHGERTRSGKGSAEYQDAILRAFREQREHPFFYDTVWDVMRLVDYLDTRDDIDSKRIGLIGISKGGVETYLTAAVDPRIACAVPCIGVQSFRWAMEHDAWQPRISTIQTAFDAAAKESQIDHPDAAFLAKFYDRVAPGITDQFDGPAMLPLIAPRPLLVINGDSDPRTPLPGLKLCTDAAQRAYHDTHADDHFVTRIEEHTAHKVTPESQEAAIAWFTRWLIDGR
jgi:cephalosporin-C deacetylase-like acetyl esterase